MNDTLRTKLEADGCWSELHRHVLTPWDRRAPPRRRSWSRAAGSYLFDSERQPLPRPDQRLRHRRPRARPSGGRGRDPVSRRSDSAGPRRCTSTTCAPSTRRARRDRALARGARPLHERRRRGERRRSQDRAARDRAGRSPERVPLLPRRHDRREQPHRRRPPPRPASRRHGHRALLRAVPLPEPVPRDERGRGGRAGARSPGARTVARGRGDRRRDRPRAVRRVVRDLALPPAYPAGVRELARDERDPARVRRGDVPGSDASATRSPPSGSASSPT